jgi:hypothetical protein
MRLRVKELVFGLVLVVGMAVGSGNVFAWTPFTDTFDGPDFSSNWDLYFIGKNPFFPDDTFQKIENGVAHLQAYSGAYADIETMQKDISAPHAVQLDFMWPSNAMGDWGNIIAMWDSGWNLAWRWSSEGSLNNWGWHGGSSYGTDANYDWSYPGGLGLQNDTWYRLVITDDGTASTIKTYLKGDGLVNTATLLHNPVGSGWIHIGARGGGPPARGLYADNFSLEAIPEPATLLLLGTGILGLGWKVRRGIRR